MHSIRRVPYRNCSIWHTSVLLVNLAMLIIWATLLNWLIRVNRTNLIVLAKWLALCLKAPVSRTLQLSKGRCALQSVVLSTTASI